MKNLSFNKVAKLCLLMMIVFCSQLSVFAYEFEVNGIYYNYNGISGDEVSVVRGSIKYSGSVIIPETVKFAGENYRVTSIGDSAFYSCMELYSITIPKSISSIKRSAFATCINLSKVNISSIESWCNITFTNNFANPLMWSKHLYLNGSEVIDLVIPSPVDSIKWGAFWGCTGIKSVTIGNSVTSINRHAFTYCSGIESIKVLSRNSIYDSRDNCNAIVETASNSLIIGSKNTIIPNSVVSIGEESFEYCTELNEVHIPNSVKTIGDYAFSECYSLSNVFVGNSVSNIGVGVFDACESLSLIQVSDENLVFDSRENCNAIIETATNTLIAGCKSTIIPNTIKAIGYAAFCDCYYLTSINIPNSVEVIGDYSFFYCIELTNIELPNSLKSIGECAFMCAGLTNLIIPDHVTSIGDDAFAGCSDLIRVSLGNSVSTIGERAFNSCHSLKVASIPNSISSIGYGAFSYCTSLDELYSYIKKPNIINMGTYVFYGVPTSSCRLFVPKGTKSVYQSTDQWSDFINIEEMENGIINGDVNGDNEVNIADINSIINIILGGDVNDNIRKCADVNGDEEINIADINKVIDVILSK